MNLGGIQANFPAYPAKYTKTSFFANAKIVPLKINSNDISILIDFTQDRVVALYLK